MFLKNFRVQLNFFLQLLDIFIRRQLWQSSRVNVITTLPYKIPYLYSAFDTKYIKSIANYLSWGCFLLFPVKTNLCSCCRWLGMVAFWRNIENHQLWSSRIYSYTCVVTIAYFLLAGVKKEKIACFKSGLAVI